MKLTTIRFFNQKFIQGIFLLYWLLITFDYFDAALILFGIVFFIKPKNNFIETILFLKRNSYILLLLPILIITYIKGFIPEAKVITLYLLSFISCFTFHKLYKINLEKIHYFFIPASVILFIFLFQYFEYRSFNYYDIFNLIFNDHVELYNIITKYDIEFYSNIGSYFFNVFETTIFLFFLQKIIYKTPKQKFYLLSLFTSSKACIYTLLALVLPKKLYICLLTLSLFIALYFNPYNFMNSRISLYNLFYDNWFIIDPFLGAEISVNNLVYLESTIYSFHNLFFDMVWLGGFIGLIFSYFVIKKLFFLIIHQNSFLSKISFLFLIDCIFAFSPFNGDTKFLFYFYSLLLIYEKENSNTSWFK
jgi:hypothetical protein